MKEVHIEGLDELDNKILTILKENARLSYSDIGAQVGLSRVAVKNRMDALEEKGIIKGYTAVIDETGMPEGRRFFLDIITEPDMFEQVVENIAKYDIIRKVYATTGESRIRAEGFAVSNMRYEMFVRSLKRNSEGIKNCLVQEVLYTIKDLDAGIEFTYID